MEIILKIILSGSVGTIVMTAFSYLISNTAKQQYREPELLNALIDRSKNLPDMQSTKKSLVGWFGHFGIGIGFVIAYWVICPEVLERPRVNTILLLGAISGLIGIAAWKIFFSTHDNPPGNNRFGYYGQLFIAHLIFSTAAILTFKGLDYIL